MGRVAVGRRPLEHPLRLEQAGKRVCPAVAWAAAVLMLWLHQG